MPTLQTWAGYDVAVLPKGAPDGWERCQGSDNIAETSDIFLIYFA